MKKTLILVVTLLFVVGVTGMAMAAITNSKHDFSNSVPWQVTTGEICKACHAPHTTNTDVDNLIWNHDPSTTATYQPYTSSTLNDTPGQPVGHSKLCLSCHDGTVAVNAFPGETGTGPAVTGALQIAKGGDDLRGQHPISILYDSGANSDDWLNYPASSVSMGANTLDQVLPGGRVECSTCHDVHNTTGEANGSFLLRLDNAGSALCLACHDK
ncbi:MAG: cytochrome c3 family protein [Nitrospiraceae bacterium]|nr:MAG: cytochrome c3 family protein [Nitrospiraceae bacterium]